MATRNAPMTVVGKTSAGLLVLLLAACGGGGGSSGGGADSGGSAGSGGDSGASSTAAFCTDLASALGQIDAATSSGAPPGQDALVQIAAQMHAVAEKAPDDSLKADMDTVANYFQLGSVHGIDSVDADVTDAANAAGDRIGTWGDANCGEAPGGG